jgi:hypothetical protein
VNSLLLRILKLEPTDHLLQITDHFDIDLVIKILQLKSGIDHSLCLQPHSGLVSPRAYTPGSALWVTPERHPGLFTLNPCGILRSDLKSN